MSVDVYADYSRGITAPASHAAAVTPNDDVDLPVVARALWIGGSGDVSVVMRGGETVTLSGAVGLVPVEVARVRATGTTATSIVALW